MGELYLPPGSRPRRFARVPPGNLPLPSGRTLQDLGPYAGGRAWETTDGLRIIASYDETPHGTLLHVSMSYADHDPAWDEIRTVKDLFYSDDIDAMMMLPSKEDYINLHPHTFHLWQTPTTWGLR